MKNNQLQFNFSNGNRMVRSVNIKYCSLSSLSRTVLLDAYTVSFYTHRIFFSASGKESKFMHINTWMSFDIRGVGRTGCIDTCRRYAVSGIKVAPAPYTQFSSSSHQSFWIHWHMVKTTTRKMSLSISRFAYILRCCNHVCLLCVAVAK